jgi:hypothetical protein
VQGFFITAPEITGEFVPRPAAQLHYGPHDLRCAGFDPTAVRGDEQALLDIRVAEGHSKIAIPNQVPLKNLIVTARLGHGTNINEESEARSQKSE